MKAQRMVPLEDYKRLQEKCARYRKAIRELARACTLHKLRAERSEAAIRTDILASLAEQGPDLKVVGQ